MKSLKFAIGIPTLNRADLLLPALKHYRNTLPEVYINVADNGNQALPCDEKQNIFVFDKPKSVAASWNFLCHHIFYSPMKNEQLGCEYAVILNDDVLVDLTRVEKIISPYIETDKLSDLFSEIRPSDILILPEPEFQWSALIIGRQRFERIGEFDENFNPAYFEDRDYQYRNELVNAPIIHMRDLNPVIFNKSATIEKDPSLNKYYQGNQDYFIKKWGVLPDSPGKYKIPFNGQQ